MKKSLLLVLALVLLSAFTPAFAHDPPSPPKVLLIVREEIKPGMMGTHARHSADSIPVGTSIPLNLGRQSWSPDYRIEQH